MTDNKKLDELYMKKNYLFNYGKTKKEKKKQKKLVKKILKLEDKKNDEIIKEV